jgi:hypothetical protein
MNRDGIATDSAYDIAELRGRDDHVDRAGRRRGVA